MGEGDPPDCKAGIERHPEARREDDPVLERDGGEEMMDSESKKFLVIILIGIVLLSGLFSSIVYQNYYGSKQPYYRVTVNEKGLPNNSSWSVNPNGVLWFFRFGPEMIYSSNNTSTVLQLQNGTYQVFVSSSNVTYSANSIYLSVDGHDATINVTFHKIPVSEAINNSYSQGLDAGVVTAVGLLFFSWLGFFLYLETKKKEDRKEDRE